MEDAGSHSPRHKTDDRLFEKILAELESLDRFSDIFKNESTLALLRRKGCQEPLSLLASSGGFIEAEWDQLLDQARVRRLEKLLERFRPVLLGYICWRNLYLMRREADSTVEAIGKLWDSGRLVMSHIRKWLDTDVPRRASMPVLDRDVNAKTERALEEMLLERIYTATIQDETS